jgi:hypothetical protein
MLNLPLAAMPISSMLVRFIARKTHKTRVPRPESGNRAHAQLCYTPATYPVLLLSFFGSLARLIELSLILVYLVNFLIPGTLENYHTR